MKPVEFNVPVHTNRSLFVTYDNATQWDKDLAMHIHLDGVIMADFRRDGQKARRKVGSFSIVVGVEGCNVELVPVVNDSIIKSVTNIPLPTDARSRYESLARSVASAFYLAHKDHIHD